MTLIDDVVDAQPGLSGTVMKPVFDQRLGQARDDVVPPVHVDAVVASAP